jgi:hypothetical protein
VKILRPTGEKRLATVVIPYAKAFPKILEVLEFYSMDTVLKKWRTLVQHVCKNWTAQDRFKILPQNLLSLH